jgi:hypothetical protein
MDVTPLKTHYLYSEPSIYSFALMMCARSSKHQLEKALQDLSRADTNDLSHPRQAY